jgi:hypothetical protein
MNATVEDLRGTIIPRSDQLNTDQLLGGPLIIKVTDVRVGSSPEQPVSIFHDMDPARAYKPCLTMRKVLVLAWGPDGRKWIGRSIELYADQSVKFGGEAVGGIRISRLSDIPKEIKVSLTATKGRKALHEIAPLKISDALTEVLADIAAATGRESLKKARAKAEALKSPADVELAVAAYKKRVDALKEKAASSTPSDRPDPNTESDAHDQPQRGDDKEHPVAVTYSRLADRVNRAADREAAELVLDEGRVLPADQQGELSKLVDAKFPVER